MYAPLLSASSRSHSEPTATAPADTSPRPETPAERLFLRGTEKLPTDELQVCKALYYCANDDKQKALEHLRNAVFTCPPPARGARIRKILEKNFRGVSLTHALIIKENEKALHEISRYVNMRDHLHYSILCGSLTGVVLGLANRTKDSAWKKFAGESLSMLVLRGISLAPNAEIAGALMRALPREEADSFLMSPRFDCGERAEPQRREIDAELLRIKWNDDSPLS